MKTQVSLQHLPLFILSLLISISTVSATNVTLKVVDSDGNPISGVPISIHKSNVGGQGTFNTDASGEITVDLANYTFKGAGYVFTARYRKSSSAHSQAITSGDEGQLIHTFQTEKATIKVADYQDNAIPNVDVTYHITNSGGGTVGTTGASGIVETELFPGTYRFTARINKTSAQTNVDITTGSPVDYTFVPIIVNFNYGGGSITSHQYNVGTTSYNGPTPVFPGTYNMRFSFPGGSYTRQYVISAGDNEINEDIFIVQVCDSEGDPLADIDVAWNHRYSSYTNLGKTASDGFLFINSGVPAGNRKFKATKNYTTQVKTTDGYVKFRTSKFIVNVKDFDGNNEPGIQVQYNHRYSSYMNIGNTDANGNASIELFSGTRKFKGIKNYTTITKTLTVNSEGSSGVVMFQLSKYVLKVLKSDGSPFSGIKVQFNHRYSSYMNVGNTDGDGKTSIELFPGNRKFKAERHYTTQVNTLNIPGEGDTDELVFQTELATAYVEDCNDNQPVAGVQIQFNHRYSSYMNVGTTGADGKASIELFPAIRKFKATINHTSEVKEVDYSGGAAVDVEFNPTLVNMNYAGTVKWNHRYSSYTNVPSDYYMFPGTYKFRFYSGSTLDLEENIAISGCSFEEALIFVQLQKSNGSGLPDATFKYRFGYGSYTSIGTDNSGDGIWYFIPGDPGNTKVRVDYKGGAVERQQNVKSNAKFIFNTVAVTADLKDSEGSGLTADNWKYRYGYGSYSSLDNTGEELLPVNVKVRVEYKGAAVEKQQNPGSAPHFAFNTVKVTAGLEDSQGGGLTADSWKYRYGYGSYSSLDHTGEELLPVNVKVRVEYKGAAVEKQQNPGSAPHFDFNTVNVTAALKASGGGGLTADSWKYRYGYGSYSSLDNTGEELLPVNVKVRVEYKGAAVEKQQNPSSAPHFEFNTVNVTAALKNQSGVLLSADSWQYRYGYGSYSTLTNSGEELLPVAVKVKVTYDGVSDEKQQHVGTSPGFIFTYNGSSIYLNTLASTPDNARNQTAAPLNNKLNIETENTLLSTQLSVFPNPVSSKATIDFAMEQEAQVNLSVFDMNGQLVRTLHKGHLQSGQHRFGLDMAAEAQGTYVFRLIIGDTVQNKMILVTH